MAYLKYKRRVGRGRKTNLGKAIGAGRKASAYNKTAKVASVVSLAKQVKRMNKQMKKNMEMKTWSGVTQVNSFGQVIGNSPGYWIADLALCSMASGPNDSERNGLKTVLKGLMIRLQLTQQSASTGRNKISVEVWKTYDYTTALSSVIQTIYNPDSISGVIDINSTRNKDHIGKGAPYICVGRRTVTLQQDTVSGINQYVGLKMFIKQNQELLYSGGASQNPQNVRYFIIMRCAHGNASATTASTLNVPYTAINTGINLLYKPQCWYIDN